MAWQAGGSWKWQTADRRPLIEFSEGHALIIAHPRHPKMAFDVHAPVVIEHDALAAQAFFHDVRRGKMPLAGQPAEAVYHAVTR